MTGDRWHAGDAYEAYMGRWSRRLAAAFIDWLGPPGSANWLEVGSGTGALTSAIVDRCDPVTIVACDPSAPFVEHARQALGDPRVSFVVAGADALPRREGGFDVAVSGLVLNFVPNPEQAIASIRDRLRSGGTVAAYLWDYADGMEFLRTFWEEAVAVNPAAAAVDERRRFPLCSKGALARLFERAGLQDVQSAAIEVPTDFVNFEDYWTPFLRGTGPAPSYVASLDARQRVALEERLRQRLPAADDGRIHLRARAWAVRGMSH